MNKVSLQKCENYDNAKVRCALEKIFSDFGGLDKLVKKGDNVLLKCNLINAFKIEKAVTTHPVVVEEVAKLILEQGAFVTIADSSGGLFNKAHMDKVYKVTKMTEVSQKLGVKLNDDFTSGVLEVDGVVTKDLDVISCVLNADVVFNLAKLKTHTLTRYTGCTKNLFGVIPGLKKVAVHGIHKELSKFVNFLLDIDLSLEGKVSFHILDGVTAMEGDGPSAGTPKDLFVLLGGKNSCHVDMVAMNLIGKHTDFPQFNYALERGMVPKDLSEIEISGEPLSSLKAKHFILPKLRLDSDLFHKYPKFVRDFIRVAIMTYPKVKKKDCRGCSKCADHCPPKAISMETGKAVFDYDKCIRCFCCQELCPFSVIYLKSSIGSKILRKRK